eukprot:jgi/Botrbrau1/7442/Bobra.0083s0015.1
MSFKLSAFQHPFSQRRLLGVKQVVSEKMPQGVNSRGLTLAGFLFLHALFITKGRLETTWAVLRKFGYNTSLHLSDEVLSCVNFAHAPDQVVELTEVGRTFLESEFLRFNTKKDDKLTPQEQAEMFSTCPSSPWEEEEYQRVLVEATPTGSLTKQGFLSKWAYMTAVNPRQSLAYMLYLGFQGDPSHLFCFSRPRRQERKGDTPSRSFYRCAVFGAEGSGKSSLVRAFVGADVPAENSHNLIAVGPVPAQPPGNFHSPTLMLEEFSERAAEQLLTRESCAESLAVFDCAAFLFDNSQVASFRIALQLLLRVATRAGDSLPCLFLASKDDLPMPKDLVRECGEVCGLLALPLPLPLSMHRRTDGQHVYTELIQAARHPERAIPLTPSLRAQRQYRNMLKRAALYTALGVTSGLVVYGLYRLHKRQQQQERRGSS